jgi:hypothetical protein
MMSATSFIYRQTQPALTKWCNLRLNPTLLTPQVTRGILHRAYRAIRIHLCRLV